MSALRIVPCDFVTATEFVTMHHRHHQPPVGHKFSIGLADNDELVGVAIVGRPVARAYQDGIRRTARQQRRDWAALDRSIERVVRLQNRRVAVVAKLHRAEAREAS